MTREGFSFTFSQTAPNVFTVRPTHETLQGAFPETARWDDILRDLNVAEAERWRGAIDEARKELGEWADGVEVGTDLSSFDFTSGGEVKFVGPADAIARFREAVLRRVDE